MTNLSKIKILFLASNPHDLDNVDVYLEYKEIMKIIEREPYKDVLDFKLLPEVVSSELVTTLASEKPNILHFSGHAQKDGIILNWKNEGSAIINERLFREIINNLKPEIQLVVLNACNTATIAKKIASSVGCSIGTTTDIEDRTAILFASKFYLMMALGYSIKKSFNLSITNLEVEELSDYRNYKIFQRDDVNPDDLYLLNENNYKGNLFLRDPLIWNSYFTIIDYLLKIHDQFFIIQNRFIKEFISKCDEILKEPNNLSKITSFIAFWDLYCERYNSNSLKDNLSKISEAFKTLQIVKDEKIKIINTAKSDYFDKVTDTIEDYDHCHRELSKKMKDNLMKNIKDQETTSQIFQLTRNADYLITITYELLKKLVELLH
jgi:hypothetical protein